MTIIVRATSSLRAHVPAAATVEDVRTVGEALERLDLAHLEGVTFLVNGRSAFWGTELHDGDTLQLLTAMAGGQAISCTGAYHNPYL